MEKITVVYDGTAASELLHLQLCQRLAAEGIEAHVRRFDIHRDSASGLCSASGIREFRGSIRHLAENIGDATMLLVHLAPVSREVLEAGTCLRFVGSERSSVVNIDVAEAARRGIRVCYAPGRNARTVAEFTVGLLLAATRSIASSNALVHAGSWTRELDRAPYTGVELEGKQLGLVGFGGIGRQVAQLVRGFGMDVCYYDPFSAQGVESARPMGLDELLSTSDFISVHARAEEGAPPLLDAAALGRIKPGAYLINTARGQLVDQNALIDCLLDGRLAGAALDVYVQEPLPADCPLLHMPQVVLCPHLGGLSKDMAPRSAAFVIEDVLHFLRGEPLAREYRAQGL